MFKETLERMDGISQFHCRIPMKDLFDIFSLCRERNEVGKDFHIDLIVSLDVYGALSVTGAECLACLLECLAEFCIIDGRRIHPEAEIYTARLRVLQQFVGKRIELRL